MPTSSKKVRELKKTKNWLAKSMKKQPKKVALTDNSAQDCAIRPVSYTHLDVYKRQNSASATLETAFTSSGKTIGITAASASLDGTWRIRPAASFYRDDTPITPESPVAAPTVSGQFSHVTPVSYTHLKTLEHAVENNPRHPGHDHDEDRVKPFEAPHETVSYTHLDVYKRQIDELTAITDQLIF